LKTDWYDYGFRFYDPVLGRFVCSDPLSDKFHWVSPYNYAENSPIACIDFWGLQKVYFMSGIKEKKGFQNSYSAARSTTAGKAFTKALKAKGQTHYDVAYFELKGTNNSGVSTILSSENDDVRKTIRKPEVSSNLNPETFDYYFKNNPDKELILIGVDLHTNNDENNAKEIVKDGEEILHEENHAIDVLTGENDNQNDDHEQWFGENTGYSPDAESIKNDPKYKDTKAYQAVMELYNWVNTNIKKDE
jgi:hypothetical protein